MNYLTVRRPRNGQTNLGSQINDFDHLFDSVFGVKPGWTETRPAVDVRATDEAYIIDADLPGFSEDQIDIRVENDLLVIVAQTEMETESDTDSKTEYLLRERGSRSYRRSFALPKDADPSKIEARFQNGVLNLTLSKRAEAKPRKIEIKRG